MLTELLELYRLYQIHTKLNSLRTIEIKTLSSARQDVCVMGSNESLDTSTSTLTSTPHLDTTNLEKACCEIKQLIIRGGFIYIKFAQWIISRLRTEKGDNIQFITNYFDDMFDQCPYHDLVYTRDIFTADIGIDLFTFVKPETLVSIASGSVGQVYKAELTNPAFICKPCNTRIYQTHTGLCTQCYGDLDEITTVAIKIKHPNIDKQVTQKTKLFNFLEKLQKYKWIKDSMGLHMDIHDFVTNLQIQSDFKTEITNNTRLHTNFKDNPLIYIPLILQGTSNILITEFVDGITINDIHDYAQLKCCYNYACMIQQMISIDNFCHGDLHHKNWKIRRIPQSAGKTYADDYQIIVYDYGICFSTQSITFNRQVIESFETGNYDLLLANLPYLISGTYDDSVLQIIEAIILKYRSDHLDMIDLFNKLNTVLINYNCRLTTDSLNIILLLSLIEDTLRKQNLIGGNFVAGSGIDAIIVPSSIIRSKNLDIIAYAKSRSTYHELVQFMEAQQRLIGSQICGGTVKLFGSLGTSGMIFDSPE